MGKILAATICLVLLISGGCRTVTIESDPPGAKLYLQGKHVGTTPFTRTFWVGEVIGATAELVFPGHERSECPQGSRGAKVDDLPITSAPGGASVFMNGANLGPTPLVAPIVFAKHFRCVLDKEAAGPGESVTADLRVIRVSDGTAIIQASARSTPGALDSLAKEIADKLRDGVRARGEPIAVVSLRNRGGTARGKVVAEELADKVSGALIESGWFDVKERVDLRAILDERDLETAAIVRSAKVQSRLAGIGYVVIGGVTVSESR